nr:hypothetical protein [Comamonas sp.]
MQLVELRGLVGTVSQAQICLAGEMVVDAGLSDTNAGFQICVAEALEATLLDIDIGQLDDFS